MYLASGARDNLHKKNNAPIPDFQKKEPTVDPFAITDCRQSVASMGMYLSKRLRTCNIMTGGQLTIPKESVHRTFVEGAPHVLTGVNTAHGEIQSLTS